MQTAGFLLLTINIRNKRSFVKHELTGGLKYLGIEISTRSPSPRRDRYSREIELYDKHLSLPMYINNM
jgi:hypothetical protein